MSNSRYELDLMLDIAIRAEKLFGPVRERYRVQKETKRGYWSKMFTDVHPGQVQRAYWRAGLAPDIPKEAME